jgi:hypothetical protein
MVADTVSGLISSSRLLPLSSGLQRGLEVFVGWLGPPLFVIRP